MALFGLGKNRQKTAQEAVNEALMKRGQTPLAEANSGIRKPILPIGEKEIVTARATLLKYKQGKANLERKIIDNEQWFKLRHWEQMRKKSKSEVKPTSAWLLNSILNKHADAMDNYPSPNILPREAMDTEEAKRLSSIIPVVLEMNDFEGVYSDVWWYKLKSGTGVYHVYYDTSKMNGLGDISVAKTDLLNLFWQPGIGNIQNSKHLFHVELEDNDTLIEAYPQLEGKLGSQSNDVAKYIYDDTVDTSMKSAVVDWYYKKTVNGKQVVHLVKFVNNEVLFATENEVEPQYDEFGEPIGEPMAITGLYDHGKYPFIFDALYPVEGMPTGFGFIDIGKDCQAYIDRGGQAIMKNMLWSARPRYFSSSSSAINEEEFADLDNDIVHVEGNLSADTAIPITTPKLDGIYFNVMQQKIEELKETTGNRDVMTGGTSGGATAASAIASQIEMSSKLSRDINKASYRAYREMIVMVIELIRQFYDIPRQFRIIGQAGAQEFIAYTNAGLTAQDQGFGDGFRMPYFDIEVTAQRASSYSKLAQNELALQFYQMGFFNPQMADAALACLSMMDFDRKDAVMQIIQQNRMMYLQMMMAMPAAETQTSGGEEETAEDKEALGGDAEEPAITKNARERVAESTNPN